MTVTTSNRLSRISQTSQTKNHLRGSLADAMKGADIFIGVSAPGVVTEDMIKSDG